MSMTSSAPLDHATIDPRHLLIVGAGPGVGGSIARRFAEDGYHITLLARAPEDVADLAKALVDTGVVVDTLTADAGTILFTGGGFADHPVPALATLSLGKAALRSAATILGAELAEDGIRVATVTIAGVVARGTPFDPDRIAETFWRVAQSDGDWQSEFRFEGT
jgi:short-subunit dehydrogenase